LLNRFYTITEMKNTTELYNSAMELLKGCNEILKEDPQLPTINVKLAGVVKDLNEIRVKELTGIQSEQ
jgi:hypothetical protein